MTCVAFLNETIQIVRSETMVNILGVQRGGCAKLLKMARKEDTECIASLSPWTPLMVAKFSKLHLTVRRHEGRCNKRKNDGLDISGKVHISHFKQYKSSNLYVLVNHLRAVIRFNSLFIVTSIEKKDSEL